MQQVGSINSPDRQGEKEGEREGERKKETKKGRKLPGKSEKKRKIQQGRERKRLAHQSLLGGWSGKVSIGTLQRDLNAVRE